MSDRKALLLKAQQSLDSKLGYTCVNELFILICREIHMCALAAMRRSSANPLFSEIRQNIYSQRKCDLRFERVYFLKMQKCLFRALTYAPVCLRLLNKRKSLPKTLMAFPEQNENLFEAKAGDLQ